MIYYDVKRENLTLCAGVSPFMDELYFNLSFDLNKNWRNRVLEMREQSRVIHTLFYGENSHPYATSLYLSQSCRGSFGKLLPPRLEYRWNGPYLKVNLEKKLEEWANA